jgi:putative peptidoglycan lipid II flippase
MPKGFLKSESYSGGIFLSLVFNIAARLTGFATSLVIGFYFGTSSGADIYFYALNAITLVTGFAIALNSMVLVPEMMRLRAAGNSRAAMEYGNCFLYIYGFCAVLACLGLTAPCALFNAVSKFDVSALAAQTGMLRLAVAVLSLNLVNLYLTDIAVAGKFFTMPMLSNMLLNVCAITCMLLFARGGGISAAMGGLLLGNMLQLVFLLGLLARYGGWDFTAVRFSLGRGTLKNIVYSQAGNLTGMVAFYVPLYLLSGCGAGVVSAMNYARQVADMPHLAFTNQFSSVAGIKFNEHAGTLGPAELNPVFIRSIRILLFTLVPAAIFFALFSREIMSVLYLRGKFDSQSLSSGRIFLMLFAVTIPFTAFNTLSARLNMAFDKLRAGMWYQAASNAVAAVIFAFCIPCFGAYGYALGFAVFGVVNVAGLYFYVRAVFPGIDYGAALVWFSRTAVFMLLAALPALLVKLCMPGVPPVLTLLAGFTCYVAVILSANRMLRLNEDADGMLSDLLAGKMPFAPERRA